MKRCSRSTKSQSSADGQIDGEIVKDLAHQVNEALKAILKRVEALESARTPSDGTASIVINVNGASSIGIESGEGERMGFKPK
jgi:hypothetical protein